MPSPFNNPVGPQSSAASPDGVRVDGEFHCEFCFHVDVTAYYDEKKKRLAWRCPSCDALNLVRNFEL